MWELTKEHIALALLLPSPYKKITCPSIPKISFALLSWGTGRCVVVSIQGYFRFVWFRTFEHNFLPLFL